MKELKVGDSFLYEDELWEVGVIYPYSYETVLKKGSVTEILWWPKNHLHKYLSTCVSPTPSHTHTLKLYQGFTDTYNYCTECNHKENV